MNCTSEDVGEKYNVGTNKIIFKVSVIANIDNVNNYSQMTGGTDEETDDELRERIQLATQVQSKATVTALRQAVLAVEGITSVSVDDMPLLTRENEPHTYATGVDEYVLDLEVAVDNGDFVISDTIDGPADYINGTDYIVENSIVVWQGGGSHPGDTDIFYVNYNYNWLGHVQMYVSGNTTLLGPTVVTAVDTAIEDTKAAGIVVEWDEPTIVTVDVEVNILIDTANGYSFDTVSVAVESALEAFLNAKEVGTDVYISEIIATCQGVTGVINTTVTTPGADVTIDSNEVAKAGTITVNEL